MQQACDLDLKTQRGYHTFARADPEEIASLGAQSLSAISRFERNVIFLFNTL